MTRPIVWHSFAIATEWGQILLLTFWVEKTLANCIKLQLLHTLPMHSFLFMHSRLKSCTSAQKLPSDWSAGWARAWLVEISAFLGCLANVAACLNSCFMHTNFHTNLLQTSAPHHHIITISTSYHHKTTKLFNHEILQLCCSWCSTGPQNNTMNKIQIFHRWIRPLQCLRLQHISNRTLTFTLLLSLKAN